MYILKDINEDLLQDYSKQAFVLLKMIRVNRVK